MIGFVLVAALGMSGGIPAAADTAPVNPNDPRTPVTVSSDPLPTAQHDGVAWQQVVVGNTVYVAGRFTRARPAGAAPGSQTVVRNNIMAYDLTTGALITTFAPSLNAQALTIAAAPDGSRIYVGGDFTSVNGTQVWRVAALNPSTGALIASFRPRVGGQVRAITVTNSAVYVGGNFGTVGTATRTRLAAMRPADGALLGWNPSANLRVNALVASPDSTQIVVGGAFTTLNGSNRPGYGLGRVNATTGASLPFNANNTVRNGGSDSAILSLSSDGTNVYGTGYIFGTGGNLEGGFAARWSDGNIHWVEDCHGDTYGIWASSTAVYTAGHAHYCGNLGGFPETSPRTWHRAVAFSRAATGVMTRDIHGYPSFTGVAAPSVLNWFPDLDTGTASGQNQGPWAVAGNEQYVVMAGEFRNVNGRPQQGLVRFAVRSLAPNRDGPRVSGANFRPTLAYLSPGTVRVRWQANWDRDNTNLTYRIIRNGNIASPAGQVTRESTFWQRPTLEFTDSGLAAGTHSYRIFAVDPLGNETRGDTVTVTVPVGGGGAANTPPSASFTSSAEGLAVAVDGSGSTDADGTIASYAWEFGDGATATGATASHTYAAAGTYTVRLTVTDNGGATSSTTGTVTAGGATPPAGVLAADGFGRNLAAGWGSADTGGAWTLQGSSAYFSVAEGQGRIRMASGGQGPSAFLGGVSLTSTDTTVRVSAAPVGNGSGTYVSVVGRRIDSANRYWAQLKAASSGALTLAVARQAGTQTTLAQANVAGALAAGNQVNVRVQVAGTNPTAIRAKAWHAGAAEPAAWHVQATDNTAALQAPGAVGLGAYISGSTTNTPVVATFDGLEVRAPAAG
ncbi:hypothetical protein NCCP1664_11730 [Zafaria cholistanensis]|uniref:PKD domain-containing protein n=1 Tax=Zafaria cholistanensis TaxID=1682741 RepID=A0A5A7NQ50_9MICC|nr:hypothetical protein NCCP1664_11730 [Zafaria cholistanensis]